MMAKKAPQLAVVTPELEVMSESFIGAHIEGLLDEAKVIWGSPRPLFLGDGEGVLSGLPGALAHVLGLGWRMTPMRAHGAVGRRLPEQFYALQLARFLHLSQIDVVLAEYGTTAVEIMEACSISGTPLVVHFHGFDAYQEQTLSEMREPYRDLFRIAKKIVVVSNHMLAHLLNLGSPAERTVCNPCGVNVERFQGAEPEVAPPLLLALGRFVEKKGPALTLEAFSLVHADEPQTQLVMLGDGPLRDECIDRARKLGIDRHVRFPGGVDHKEVVVWMRQARCFVQHSLRASDGDSEGTPVAILEASACGLPVVSTKHGGIIDAVIDGTTGLLVDEGEVEDMAEQMLRLVRDPGLAATLGAAGRRHMVDNYSAEKSLSRLRGVLLDAVEIGR
jgi:glycosyltransferase involved in cell wall biosynthesis